MKHGIRYWQTKLNKKISHRNSLVANLLGQLVQHEQIQTTYAKAKVIQHEIEKVINIAKNGSSADIEALKEKVNGAELALPKLLTILKRRYANTAGGYARVLKNGYRSSGSDRAPLAIVELVANPNDIVVHSSLQHVPVLKSQIQSINQRKYLRKVVTLRNLSTGLEQRIEKMVLSPSYSNQTKKMIDAKERAIHKKLIRFNKNVIQYSHARSSDSESFAQIDKVVNDDGDQIQTIPKWIVPSLAKSSSHFIPARKMQAGKSDTPLANQTKPSDAIASNEDKSNESVQEKDNKESEAPKIPQSFFQRFFRSSK